MREVDAVYGGEMSAHHYFREFSYCDSGMIPWLLVLAGDVRARPSLVGAGRGAHAALPRERRDQPAPVDRCRLDPEARARALRERGRRHRLDRRSLDGIPRLALQPRGSNTEPLVRLNVESRGNEALMREKTAEVLKLVDG